MAREGRRRREARRFGTPRRLADIVLGVVSPRELGVPGWATDRLWLDRMPELAGECQRRIASCVVVEASNIAEYYYSYCEKSQWDCEGDFPACRPPFDWMFVEFQRPAIFRDEGGAVPFDPSFYERWGWIIETLPAGQLKRWTGDAAIDSQIAPMLDLPGIWAVLRMTLVYVQMGSIVPAAIVYFTPIDNAGNMLGNHKSLVASAPGDDRERAMAHAAEVGQLAHTAYLAISFMNCKGVIIEPHEPDPVLNRERQRNGRKPFVRYHTINVEPMKRVLRTEGHIESEGLKKALHICRGYFATYTEDRPLFGRSGLHGTFWVPAHVRGSSKEGIVVSDYRVNLPKGKS
jgi:hypothetical protein